jgi:hypothetical protein
MAGGAFRPSVSSAVDSAEAVPSSAFFVAMQLLSAAATRQAIGSRRKTIRMEKAV